VAKPFEGDAMGFVLTRLHARYGKTVTEDLIFKAAEPIVGGREFLQDNGKLEERSRPFGINNFQARYAIRHEWTGPITCQNPIRGRWGGPPNGVTGGGVKPALDLAFAKRGEAKLPELVRQDIPEIEGDDGEGAGGQRAAADGRDRDAADHADRDAAGDRGAEEEERLRLPDRRWRGHGAGAGRWAGRGGPGDPAAPSALTD
jgi:hypothetical protein